MRDTVGQEKSISQEENSRRTGGEGYEGRRRRGGQLVENGRLAVVSRLQGGQELGVARQEISGPLISPSG
jgi:hypothetical protein